MNAMATKRAFWGMLLLAFSMVGGACSSTGVIPMDRDTFMIAKDRAAPGASGARVLAEIYVEANAHCATTSRGVETIHSESVDPIPFVRAGSAKLEFRCVSKS